VLLRRHIALHQSDPNLTFNLDQFSGGTPSRECRNCHSYHAMDFTKQSRRAAEKMRKGLEAGKTCIDCHKGIAHKLPADYDDDD
jgi:nitrate/TMAO reductase-like tetraheme cytochrome c subunit